MTEYKRYEFNLNVGDWSKNGHEQCTAILLQSNSDKQTVMEAYIAGCNKAGVALHRNKDLPSIATEYEENCIYPEDLKKLTDVGFDYKTRLSFYVDDLEADDPIMMDEHDILEIFIFLVRLGNDSVWLMPIETPKHENLNGFWDDKYNFTIGYGVLS